MTRRRLVFLLAGRFELAACADRPAVPALTATVVDLPAVLDHASIAGLGGHSDQGYDGLLAAGVRRPEAPPGDIGTDGPAVEWDPVPAAGSVLGIRPTLRRDIGTSTVITDLAARPTCGPWPTGTRRGSAAWSRSAGTSTPRTGATATSAAPPDVCSTARAPGRSSSWTTSTRRPGRPSSGSSTPGGHRVARWTVPELLGHTPPGEAYSHP